MLKSGEKYQMKQQACVNELHISEALPEDSGEYSCVCGENNTAASLTIKGRRNTFWGNVSYTVESLKSNVQKWYNLEIKLESKTQRIPKPAQAIILSATG